MGEAPKKRKRELKITFDMLELQNDADTAVQHISSIKIKNSETHKNQE